MKKQSSVKKKRYTQLLPELYHEGNDLYVVRIPISFMPQGTRFVGVWHEYRFIGIRDKCPRQPI